MSSITALRDVALVDPLRQARGDVIVQDGRIAAVGEDLPIPPGALVVEGRGRTLLPAFVDLHAHFRDPGLTHKEDIASGCRAAAHGGYAAVHLMPNTRPVCSTPDTVRYVREKAAALGLCDVFQSVSITRDFDGKTLDHLDDLEPSVRLITDDGYGVQDTAVVLRAMEIAKAKGVGVMLHEEDNALIEPDSYLAEELMTFRDVQLALHTGCHTHFCHVSTKNAMEYILAGKRRGGNITCEVTPHHLALNDETRNKVNPPLRAEKHRRYLIECVKNGLVDAISTDHAPHTTEEKAAGANGFTGLDVSFAVCYTALVREGHIPLPALSGLLSAGPAAILGLELGYIREGMPASLTLVDLDASFTVTEDSLSSRGKNTPFMGQTLWGKICMTIKEGNIIYGEAD